MKKLLSCGVITLSTIALIACSNSNSELTTTSQSSTTTTTTSSSFEEIKTLESYAKNDMNLGEYEYNSEFDAYIVSGDLGGSLGDKIAIESFNDVVYDAVHQGFKTDKPVIFRGWYEQQGTTFAGIVIYFSVDNFNRDWSEINFDSIKTYQFSDGWSSTAKYGQYLSSVSKADNEDAENTLFNLLHDG